MPAYDINIMHDLLRELPEVVPTIRPNLLQVVDCPNPAESSRSQQADSRGVHTPRNTVEDRRSHPQGSNNAAIGRHHLRRAKLALRRDDFRAWKTCIIQALSYWGSNTGRFNLVTNTPRSGLDFPWTLNFQNTDSAPNITELNQNTVDIVANSLSRPNDPIPDDYILYSCPLTAAIDFLDHFHQLPTLVPGTPEYLNALIPQHLIQSRPTQSTTPRSSWSTGLAELPIFNPSQPPPGPTGEDWTDAEDSDPDDYLEDEPDESEEDGDL